MNLSKKNIVQRENDKILKKFTEELDFYTEYFFYQEYAYSPFISNLYEYKYNLLILEYINGKNLYELLNEGSEISDIKIFISSLAHSLKQLHEKTYNYETNTCLIHKDTNIKNYLFKDKIVYIIDFSDIEINHPFCDIFSVSLFLCEIFSQTDFEKIINTFLNSYNSDMVFKCHQPQQILKDEIARFDLRRKSLAKNIDTNNVININRAYLLQISYTMF